MISKKRTQEIINLAIPGVPPETPEHLWNDDAALRPYIRAADRKRKQWLGTSDKPQELQLFAENWHWDGGGGKPLQILIANPHCDAGTMMYLFWLGSAEDYYFQFSIIKAIRSEFDREIFRLLRQIERKIVTADYACAKIYFDPAPYISMYERRNEFARSIPDIMYKPIGKKPRNKK